MRVYKHEDERRIVLEWIKDYPIKSCKVIIANDDVEIGGHYHNKKEDIFYLLSGWGSYKLGKAAFKRMKNPVIIRKGVRHIFRLKKNAILLEASTERFDIKDEIK